MIVKIGRLTLFAFPALQVAPETRSPAFIGKHPFTHPKRRVVPYVLVVAAFELRTPVAFVVHVEPGDRACHFFVRYPVLVRRGLAGFHHR